VYLKCHSAKQCHSPPTPASWHYQLALPITFLHAPFLFLLHQSRIHYLHTFALSTISVHLSVISNHTFSSQLSLPSHSVPAPLIHSLRFWRPINLVVCMYVKLQFLINNFSETHFLQLFSQHICIKLCAILSTNTIDETETVQTTDIQYIPALPVTTNLLGRSSSLPMCCNDATNASIRSNITGTSAFAFISNHTNIYSSRFCVVQICFTLCQVSHDLIKITKATICL